MRNLKKNLENRNFCHLWKKSATWPTTFQKFSATSSGWTRIQKKSATMVPLLAKKGSGGEQWLQPWWGIPSQHLLDLKIVAETPCSCFSHLIVDCGFTTAGFYEYQDQSTATTTEGSAVGKDSRSTCEKVPYWYGKRSAGAIWRLTPRTPILLRQLSQGGEDPNPTTRSLDSENPITGLPRKTAKQA